MNAIPAAPEGAGRYDHADPDEREGPTVPEDKDATIERLDDETERLTHELDLLRGALSKICDETFQIAVNGHLMVGDQRAQELSRLDIGAIYETARAALARLEDES